MPRLSPKQIDKAIIKWRDKGGLNQSREEYLCQVQYDQDMKELEQAKQETAREIFEELENPCPFEGIKRLCSMCVVILKSQFIKEK
jgi:hypothetical protein